MQDDKIVQEEYMRRYLLMALVSLIAVLSSCTLAVGPSNTLDSTNLADFQRRIMTTFDILNGSAITEKALTPFENRGIASQSKATVPIFGSQSFDLPTAGITEPVIIDKYPEVDQTSSWTVGTTTTANVYLVKVATVFADGDIRKHQDEWYYILSSDLVWTTADPVCKEDGTPAQSHRARNRLTYDDGSYQDEVIVNTKYYSDTDAFAAFGIDGSLDYPGAFLPKVNDDASYSSVVVYTRTFTDKPDFSFWSGNRVQTIVGIRYYTEILSTDHSVLTGSMIVFEKSITSLYSYAGDFLDAYSSLFLPVLSGTPDQAMLALTVIRQESTYKVASYTDGSNYTLSYSDPSNTRDTRAKTRVVNIPAQKDNYVTRINDEASEITEAYNTLWIPAANDPAIIDLSTATTIDIKDSNEVVAADGSQPIVITTDSPTGDLGTLYASIENGTLVGIGETSDIEGDLSGTGDVNVFSGSQGIRLPNPDNAFGYHLKGTVQAWVYINAITDTPGIVHAGILPDFPDELFSLQFMGANTAPVFGLVAQSPYKYDLVTSNKKLATKRWYYVVATWDVVAKSLKIYVDAEMTGSIATKNVKTTSVFSTDAPIVIGSQFFDDTKVLKGYYGFNGKINGVLIDDYVWTAEAIKAFYDANKAKTSSW